MIPPSTPSTMAFLSLPTTTSFSANVRQVGILGTCDTPSASERVYFVYDLAIGWLQRISFGDCAGYNFNRHHFTFQWELNAWWVI